LGKAGRPAAAVRGGHVDPVNLVQESLRRTETHHGRLYAVTALGAEAALAEAAGWGSIAAVVRGFAR
jgi:hypothetical protein